MLRLIEEREAELTNACRKFGVERLEVFGSAAVGGYDPAASDLDFLVSFSPEAREKAFDNFFGLKEQLEAMFGRPVDLLTANSIRNPYLRREIEQQRQLVYGA